MEPLTPQFWRDEPEPFSSEQLLENAQVVLEAIGKAKPAAFKGHYIKTAVLSSTMSPAVRIASTEYGKY